ncbi:MAG TPA: LysR family transcriptional regulator [Bacillales bacterium]|nr:LysR family transcriptional regulator [Bacillales bacterium]
MDQHLLVFVTVAEKKNFSRAAEALHMTQPAVSQYVKTLEQDINATLLERNNKMVRMTKAGEVVYHHAKEILGLYARMKTLVVDLMQTAGGPLAIGASYSFGEYVLPQLLADLLQQYPLIKPSVMIGNSASVADKISRRQLDIGIIEGDVHDQKLAVQPLVKDYMMVVVSHNHRFARKKQVELADLQQETWIVREEGSGTREMTEKMFSLHQFKPEKTMEFGSTQLIKESVAAGIGVSFLSQWTIRRDLEAGTLKALPLKEFPFTRNFSLITQATPFQTKAAKVFLELMEQNAPRLHLFD